MRKLGIGSRTEPSCDASNELCGQYLWFRTVMLVFAADTACFINSVLWTLHADTEHAAGCERGIVQLSSGLKALTGSTYLVGRQALTQCVVRTTTANRVGLAMGADRPVPAATLLPSGRTAEGRKFRDLAPCCDDDDR
jgi:hypothetical protein